MDKNVTNWEKKEYPKKMESDTFEVIEVWFRQNVDNIETYILIYDKYKDKYVIKYNNHKASESAMDLIKNTISSRFRNISFDFNKGIIKYNKNVNFSINLDQSRTVSEYDMKENAKDNLKNVLF